MPTGPTWNPRYVAYATAHGRTPEEMLAYDLDRWPGARMAGYIIWNQHAWRAWAEAVRHPRAHDLTAPLSKQDHVAFDKWLEHSQYVLTVS